MNYATLILIKVLIISYTTVTSNVEGPKSGTPYVDTSIPLIGAKQWPG
jgi:hypothetical protein